MQPIPNLENAHILVVRRDNIGDLVCTTPLLRSLKETFPQARIGVLVNVYNAEVLHGNPDVDELFVYQKIKHVRGVWPKIKATIEQIRLRLRLKAWRPTVSILAKAVYDRHGLKYLRSIGAGSIIGYRDERYPLQPDMALEPAAFGDQHEIAFLADLLKPLGINTAPGPLSIYPQPEAVAAAQDRLPSGRIHLALHISARDPERQWGVDHWVALIDRVIAANPNATIVLLWSPGQGGVYINGEDALAATVMDRVGNPNLVPMPVTSITELVATLAVCDGFVGVDGGAMHIACALHKPLVALFERIPEKWVHWAPWQADAEVIKTKADVIASIPVDTVFQATQRLIERIRHASNTP